MTNNVQQNQNIEEISFSEIWSIFRRRRKFIGTLLFTFMSVVVVYTSYQRIFNPIYSGRFTLLINDPLNKKNNSNDLGDGLIENLARNTTDNDIPTLIELLKSSYLLSKLGEKYNINSKVLSNRIQIATGGKDRFDKKANGILKVSYKTRNPKKDISLLKDLSELYLQTALNQRRQRLVDGLSFLNKQAPELARKTAELQTEMAIFRQKNSLLEPNIEGSALKKLEEDVVTEILRLETERERLENVSAELKKGNLNVLGFETGIYPNNQFQSKGLAVSTNEQSLLKEILLVKNELAKALSKYQPESKRVLTIKARLNQLEPKLISNQLEAVDTALNLNQGRLDTANSQREKLIQNFSEQPELIKQFETIQQRLKIAQENLSGLISARETFQLEMAQRSFPWRIIEEPFIIPTPISPSIPRNLVYGLFISLTLSFFLGLLREWSDNVFYTIKEIEEYLQLPVLANIPYVENFKNIRKTNNSILNIINEYISDDKEVDKESRYQRFFYQESLRSLYTSIKFASSDKAIKLIEITSCLPSEGKSLVNLLFAKTLAELGKKVLLVDLDLRKPQIHKRLGLNNIVGVSNYLTDKNLKLKDAIQTVSEFPNWFVMTSGIKPPDPTLLLNSEKMSNFLKKLKDDQDFDIVLLDTTPLIGISDASLISDLTDALILIISLRNVEKSLPRVALKQVNETKSIKLGLIANNIVAPSKNINPYGYGYGYGYKYGYSEYASYVEREDEAKNQNNEFSRNSFFDIDVALLKKYFKQFSDWIDN